VAAPGRGMCADHGLRVPGQPVSVQWSAGHCHRGGDSDICELPPVGASIDALDDWCPVTRAGPERHALLDGRLSAAENTAR